MSAGIGDCYSRPMSEKPAVDLIRFDSPSTIEFTSPDGTIIAMDMGRELPVDPTRIDVQIGGNAIKMMVAGKWHARVVRWAIEAKYELKRVRASRWLHHKSKHTLSGRLMSDSMADKNTDSDSQVRDAEKKFAQAEEAKAVLKSVIESLQFRQDALVSILADRRKEMSGTTTA